MKYQNLGTSGLKVPMCCLGTMTWGSQNTEEEAFEQLDYALANGVNFIDTAEVYPVPIREEYQSKTETIIGNWLESRKCRDKIILASKACGPSTMKFITKNRSAEGVAADDEVPQLSAKQIREAVEGSLRRMKTDYMDLLQLHWPSRYAPTFGSRRYRAERERACISFEEQVQVCGELIKEGKIRHWGLSNETTFGVVHFCETAKRLGVPLPISIQNDFSLVNRYFEQELAEACAPSNYNVGLLSYGPLAGGTLSGKYLDGQKPAKSRHTVYPDFQPRYYCERTMAAAARYAEIAKQAGLTPTQLALAWCGQQWYMGSVIIGATTMEQLKENIAAFEIDLSEEVLAAIDAVHMDIRNPNSTD